MTTVYAVKKEGETNERLIKRFKKQVQNSRVIQEIRNKRYFKQTEKRRIVRKRALKREMFRALREKEQFYS